MDKTVEVTITYRQYRNHRDLISMKIYLPHRK